MAVAPTRSRSSALALSALFFASCQGSDPSDDPSSDPRDVDRPSSATDSSSSDRPESPSEEDDPSDPAPGTQPSDTPGVTTGSPSAAATCSNETRRQTIGDGAIRRLSPLELDASVVDLLSEFGVSAAVPGVPLGAPNVRHDFSNTAASGHFGSSDVSEILYWAEEVSLLATADLERSLECTPDARFDGCVRRFAERLGRLAFRRPLSATETDRFASVYETLASQAGVREGIRGLWELVLQSPDFWYLSADADGGAAGRSRLTADAIASRLSYVLWGTLPNQRLRALAEAGELETETQVADAARWMLEDPRAGDMVRRFHQEWLHLDPVSSLTKDANSYPDFDADFARDLEHEFGAFVERILADGGTSTDLLTSRYGHVNRRLEPLFGLEPRSEGNDDWIWRELGPERAGILTRPAFLAARAGPMDAKLIHRGVTVIEKLLCTTLTPPDNVTIADAEAAEGELTKLAAVQSRANNPNCGGCHSFIDPIGIAFEHFDAIGGHREAYANGSTISTRGSIPLDIEFDDAGDLLQQLAARPDVRACYTRKWIAWGLGRSPTAAETCAVAGNPNEAELPIRELAVQLVSSPLFLERREFEAP